MALGLFFFDHCQMDSTVEPRPEDFSGVLSSLLLLCAWWMPVSIEGRLVLNLRSGAVEDVEAIEGEAI